MQPKISPSEALAYSTVRIECDTPAGVSTGTGFYFAFKQEKGFIPAIVTNKHVIEGSSTGRFHMHLRQNGVAQPKTHMRFDVTDFQKLWIGHPNPSVDLAVMPIGGLLQRAESQGKKPYYIPFSKEILASPEDLANLVAIEEVVMVGYPNGIWDHVNNMPVFRRGVTATHPNFNYCGKQEFMIDAACFPGSSGSPVLLYNMGNFSDREGNLHVGTRIKLLGVLYAGPQHTATGDIVVQNIPTASKPMAISRIPNNLGMVIRASRLNDFEPILNSLLKPQA